MLIYIIVVDQMGSWPTENTKNKSLEDGEVRKILNNIFGRKTVVVYAKNRCWLTTIDLLLSCQRGEHCINTEHRTLLVYPTCKITIIGQSTSGN